MKYTLDTKESFIKWKGADEDATHLGTLKFKEGTAELKDHMVTGGKVIADMNTINATGPELTDDEQHQLTQHLKSKEFFDTKQYDEIIFKIEKAHFENDLSGQVTGFMKVRDNAFGLSIPVNILFGNKVFKISGDFNLFRVNSEIHQFIGEGYSEVTPQIDISFYIIFNKGVTGEKDAGNQPISTELN